MAMLKGRYYVRKVRQGGRVTSEYVGGGVVGQCVAALDAEQRALRRAEAERARQERRREREKCLALDEAMRSYCDLVESIYVAAMHAAGYHRRDRGPWRKRRRPRGEPGTESGPAPA